MKKPNGSAIRLSRSILGIRPISVSYKLFPQSQLRRNKGLYNMVLEHRNTIDATAFARSQVSSILFYSLGDSSPL